MKDCLYVKMLCNVKLMFQQKKILKLNVGYFNNKKIKSFLMDKAAASGFNSVWNIEIK